MPEPSGVVVVTGIMAAGKSTIAQLLAERLPRSAHVRGDVYRRMIVSGRAEPTPDATAAAQAQLRLRYRLSAHTADEYAAAGFTAVVQDIILGPDLPRYLAMLRTPPVPGGAGARPGRGRRAGTPARQDRLHRRAGHRTSWTGSYMPHRSWACGWTPRRRPRSGPSRRSCTGCPKPGSPDRRLPPAAPPTAMPAAGNLR